MTALGVGGGFCFNPPTPDWVMHVRTPFGLRGTDVERPYIADHGRDIMYVGNSHVQNKISITISKLNFKHMLL